MSWKKIMHNTSTDPTVHYAIHNSEWMEYLLHALRHAPVKPDQGDMGRLHLAHLVLDHFDELQNAIDIDWGKDESEIFNDLSEHYNGLINWHNSLIHTGDHAHDNPDRSTAFLNSADDLQSHLWDVDLQKLTKPRDDAP